MDLFRTLRIPVRGRQASPTLDKFPEVPPLARGELLGACKRDPANVDIKGIRKFSVVVPAAYPHLFLYLSQGHSLIPGHCLIWGVAL